LGISRISTPDFVAVAGQTYRIALNAPPRGELIQLQCIQVGGGKSTFSFAVFNSAVSCPPGQATTAGDATVDPMVEYAGQIGPLRVVATASDRYVLSDGSDGGWPAVPIQYVNADGTSNTTAQGKLYLKFIAGGAGTFGIFITVKTEKD
jgi:hypothetical protein